MAPSRPRPFTQLAWPIGQVLIDESFQFAGGGGRYLLRMRNFTEDSESAELNKQLVRRVFDEHLSTGALAQLEAVATPSVAGPLVTAVGRLRAAFPDLVYTVEEIVGEGARVAARFTWQGTFTKTYVGAVGTFEPHGNKVASSGFVLFEIADGKVVRSSLETDRLGFLVAIGALPDHPGYGLRPA